MISTAMLVLKLNSVVQLHDCGEIEDYELDNLKDKDPVLYAKLQVVLHDVQQKITKACADRQIKTVQEECIKTLGALNAVTKQSAGV
jgi:hypothetical protein